MLLSMFAPDGEDADKEGQCSHYHLPGLCGAELSVAPEHLPEARGEHRDQAWTHGGAGGQGTASQVTRDTGSETHEDYFRLLTIIPKYTMN